MKGFMENSKEGGKKNLIILMNAVAIDSRATQGLSGGDRILIELTKRWKDLFNNFQIITCTSGERIIKNYIQDFHNLKIGVIKISPSYYNNLAKLYLYKTFKGLFFLKRLLKKYKLGRNTYLYSSSDFWPDSIPAFYAKLKYPHLRWIAGFYLFAPTPWQKDSPYKTSFKHWIRGLIYWLTQLPIYWIIKKYADFVFVTSNPDVKKFITPKRDKSKIIIIQGGVDIKESQKYLKSGKIIPLNQRRYDACFVGRFHYQKGVLELIEIWKMVCQKRREAKLAMIGVGPLEEEMKAKIKKYHLENNIELLGFRDGEKKYQIFKNSKIMVHPATYDSGGMAAAEGMAWGLPGVSFDLEALKTYYPQGMIKTPLGNLEQFSKNILRLLQKKEDYQNMSLKARKLIEDFWNWDLRAKKIYKRIIYE